MNNIDSELLEQIIKYCRRNTKHESCGIICEINEKLKFIECKNTHPFPEYNFCINPRILLEYDVKYIVHSHPIGSSRASENDKNNSNELCIPYLIYSLRDDDFYLYENVSV